MDYETWRNRQQTRHDDPVAAELKGYEETEPSCYHCGEPVSGDNTDDISIDGVGNGNFPVCDDPATCQPNPQPHYENGVERTSAYLRVNPQGDREQVRKKGRREEGTLSELDESDSHDQDKYTNRLSATLENVMAKSRLVSETKHEMDSPTGKGVASRSLGKETLGKYDTELSDMGKEWPRRHNETPAMCDVDDDGVEHKPQGVHVSKHGEPSDGHTKSVGHDWPKEPTNDGGNMEVFDGDRWADGGVLRGASTGESTQSEDWSPEGIGQLMAEDTVDLQRLFNEYARRHHTIYLGGFQEILDAHQSGFKLNESSLLGLMKHNRDFIFYEGQDAYGSYWVPNAVNANALLEFEEPGRPGGGSLPSLNDLASGGGLGVGSHDLNGPQMDQDDDLMGGMDGPQDDDLMGGMGGSQDDDLMGGMGDHQLSPLDDQMGDPTAMGGQDDFGNDDLYGPEEQAGNDYETVEDIPDQGMGGQPGGRRPGPTQYAESVKHFFGSAKQLIENHSRHPQLPQALNHAWDKHAGQVNPNACSTRIQQALLDLCNRYPGFSPIAESMAGMDGVSGTPIGGAASASNKSSWLTEEQPGPDDVEEHGDKNLLKHKPKNNADETPTVKGTGFEGGSVKESLATAKRNVTRLATHVRQQLEERASKVAHLKANYRAVVEGYKTSGGDLVQALRDAEELLQFFPTSKVHLEANYGQNRKLCLRVPSVTKRGPLAIEGKAVFRFLEHANSYADRLVAEGHTCRIGNHPDWGVAVAAKVPYKLATKCFRTIV